MPHRNAPLTETGRLRLARCVVDDGWPLRRAAERFQVSPATAARWAGRYRQLGAAGMADRSTPAARQPAPHPGADRAADRRAAGGRLGPARIAWRLGLNPSTVHKVLVRYGCPPLAHLDRAAAVPVRRYEWSRPGELVHVDVKSSATCRRRLARPWPGHRNANSQAHRDPARRRAAHGRPNLGYGYLHTALDDHSRLAYTEILADETKETAAAFLTRAHAWYAAAGIRDRPRPERQRQLLCFPPVGWHLHRPRHHRQAHPGPAAPDQRQGRALPPHPGRRMGLRPSLHLRNPAARRP